MDKIILNTGPPRTEKTTDALKESAGQNIFYVARTTKNIESTLETVNNYVPEFKNLKITCDANRKKICPLFTEKEDYQAQVIRRCGGCKWFAKREFGNEALETVNKTDQMNYEKVKEISKKYEICPMKIIVHRYQWLKRNEVPHMMMQTYEKFKQSSMNLKDTTVIFDEARYLESAAIHSQIGLNSMQESDFAEELIKQGIEPTTEKLYKSKYLVSILMIRRWFNKELMENDCYNLKTIRNKKQRRIIGNNLFEFKKYLQKLVMLKFKHISGLVYRYNEDEDAHLKEYYAALLEEAKEQYSTRNILVEGFLYKRLGQNIEFKIEPKTIEYLEALIRSGRDEFVRLYSLMKLLKQINKVNQNRRLELDINLTRDSSNTKSLTVYLVWRSMLDNVYSLEDRTMFKKTVESAKKVYLIDATPFPSEYLKWVLGGIFQIKTSIFEPNYKFKFYIENKKRNLGHLQEEKNKNELLEIVKELDQKNVFFFTRNKTERELLKNAGITDLDVSRGSGSEGVQLTGYSGVVSTGLPYQNMSADDWRKTDFVMTSGDLDFYQLNRIKMLQALYQQSFRGAKRGIDSFAVILGAEEKQLELAKKIWAWSTKIEYFDLENLQ